MVPKYLYRGTFLKNIRYFQFFVITYQLKINLSRFLLELELKKF